MAVESVDGARVSNVKCKHIRFSNAGLAFFVLRGQRQGSEAIGSVDGVTFEDIHGQTILNWGSSISGTKMGGGVHPLQRLVFSNVHIENRSGWMGNTPAPPPGYAGEYLYPRMRGPMPASGLYLRHALHVVLIDVDFKNAAGDKRAAVVTHDSDVNQR